MIRRMLAPVMGSAILLAATAGSALAKCEGPNPPDFCNEVVAWLTTDGGSSGVHLTAGTATSVEINVSRGEMPFVADSVVLVFTRIGDETATRIPAELASAGLWRAAVNLPDDGVWAVIVEVGGADGAIQRLNLDIVRVREPLAPPEQPVTPVTPATPISPATPALPIALLVAGIVAAGLTATALRDRSRRKAPAA